MTPTVAVDARDDAGGARWRVAATLRRAPARARRDPLHEPGGRL